ncbi:hypothetical protein KAR48_06640 [bacterium]|nr:hypothetical protein [bacterium]
MLKRVPVRITVTGTRGKSSVVRMLTSVLRASGARTLGKVTGTEPCYILPNGQDEVISRNRLASIIEQIRTVRRGVKENCVYLVSEIMSIHPENHLIESQRLLRPHHVIITNSQPDHLDAQQDSVADVLALDVVECSNVWLHENEESQIFKQIALKKNATLHEVPYDNSGFQQCHMNLVSALARHLSISETHIDTGIHDAIQERTPINIWEIISLQKRVHVVDAFSANEPASTWKIVDQLKDYPEIKGRLIGILNLRWDRGDRTAQWIKALKINNPFKFLYVTGGHKLAFCKKIECAISVNSKTADKIWAEIYNNTNDGDCIVGLANWAGSGAKLIDIWKKNGHHYGI